MPFTNWHLSFSRLQRYEQCPRSFKLHYVDGLSCKPSAELHFGKAMHRALERLLAEHAHTLEPAALSLERAERLWQQAWAESGVVGIGPFYEGLKILGTFVRSEGVVDPVIRRRLTSLADGDVDTIVALFTPDIWPPAFESYFGELAGLVARSRAAMRELADARRRGDATTNSVALWLADRIARGDEGGLDALRVEAERARGVAMRAYDLARGRGPSIVPRS